MTKDLSMNPKSSIVRTMILTGMLLTFDQPKPYEPFRFDIAGWTSNLLVYWFRGLLGPILDMVKPMDETGELGERLDNWLDRAGNAFGDVIKTLLSPIDWVVNKVVEIVSDVAYSAAQVIPAPAYNIMTPFYTLLYRAFIPIYYSSPRFEALMRGLLGIFGVVVPRTIPYKLYTGTSVLLSTGQDLASEAAKAFLREFNVKLVRLGDGEQLADLNVKSGCKTGNSICNTIAIDKGGCGLDYECTRYHHKSANHFLGVKADSGLVFRFVNFAMCKYENSSHLSSDRFLGGVTNYIGGKNMIVTTILPDYSLGVIAHEISHMFGAEEVTCTAGTCVMKPGTIRTKKADDLYWCDGCKKEIRDFISWMYK